MVDITLTILQLKMFSQVTMTPDVCQFIMCTVNNFIDFDHVSC